ncbi:hypothetical protein MAMMFC1_02114 [Methylomusa anaerophila]|uniref:Uncharacterized protein n=1 Tax=Methylomusa anaerophila TaxID=1930071 RepID=A0A348AK32_9FIRM|nr:hypothetical protein MAMMFC1_02114 [Methylomusa anaerophila]
MEVIGIPLAANFATVQLHANTVQFLDAQIKAIDNKIDELSRQIPEIVLLRILLLLLMPEKDRPLMSL